MKKFLFLFIIPSLHFFAAFSQGCDIKGVEDWAKVEVKLMTVKEEKLKGYQLAGEGKIDVSPQVMAFDDLSTEELTEIKKYAAKFKGCIVYVDIDDFYGSDRFPVRAINQVYFYWFVPE